MEYIEITGKTLDEAVTNACLKLEASSDSIDYEVIEKGSSGLFGMFNKPAKIKAWKKEDAEVEKAAEVKTEVKAEVKKEVKQEKKAAKKEEKEEFKAAKKAEKKFVETVVATAVEEVKETKTVEAEEKEAKTVLSHEEIESRIKNFLNDMFGAMDMNVDIKVTFDDEEECVNVDLSGEGMGVLIGKRGQTLDSIQYLTSLVLNKGKDKYVRIKVDTENYRDRRKETLESLAKNIAYKVKRSRRSVSLEPMNPYERRIIHSALQNDKFVSTRSEGEEPFRHVVVYLDREKAGNSSYKDKYNNR
ncbi:MAG: RNA-binding cell elongation regulator Jag/EloR [Lachnospira sp.]